MAETIAGLDARTTRGRYGPFTAGAVYVVARAAEDPKRLRMAKSTGGTFAPVGEAAAPSAPLPFTGVAAYRVGTVIYVAGEYLDEGSKLRDNRLRVRLWTFDTASDTWRVPVVVADQPIADTAASSLDVVVLSGTVYVLHGAAQSRKGGFLPEVALSVGPVFSTQIVGPGGGIPRSLGGLIAGDVHVHVFTRHATMGTVHHRPATGSTLGAETLVAGGDNRFYLRGFAEGGTIHLAAYGVTGEVFAAFSAADGAAPGAWTQETISAGVLAAYLSPESETAFDPGHQIIGGGGATHQLSIDAAGAVRYAKRGASAWPAPTTLVAANAGRFGLSASIDAGTLHYVYADRPAGAVTYSTHAV